MVGRHRVVVGGYYFAKHKEEYLRQYPEINQIVNRIMHCTSIHDPLIQHFAAQISELVDQHSQIVIVASPNEQVGKHLNGLQLIAKAVAARTGNIDGSTCLERIIDLDRNVHGDTARDIETHTNTLAVRQPAFLQGKAVLDIGLVLVFGNQFRAHERLLLDAGAAQVDSIYIAASYQGNGHIYSSGHQVTKSQLDPQTGALYCENLRQVLALQANKPKLVDPAVNEAQFEYDMGLLREVEADEILDRLLTTMPLPVAVLSGFQTAKQFQQQHDDAPFVVPAAVNNVQVGSDEKMDDDSGFEERTDSGDSAASQGSIHDIFSQLDPPSQFVPTQIATNQEVRAIRVLIAEPSLGFSDDSIDTKENSSQESRKGKRKAEIASEEKELSSPPLVRHSYPANRRRLGMRGPLVLTQAAPPAVYPAVGQGSSQAHADKSSSPPRKKR